MHLSWLLLLVAALGCKAALPEGTDPWATVLNRELMKMRDCFPHEYQDQMNQWFVKLNDTEEYVQLYTQALDSMYRALNAGKPFCRTLNQALHGTVRRLQYQLAQEQHHSTTGRGWRETLEHLKAQRHTLLRQCDEKLYVSQRRDIRRCMGQAYTEAMQHLAARHVG